MKCIGYLKAMVQFFIDFGRFGGVIYDVVPPSINIIIFYIEKPMNTFYEFGLYHEE